MIHSEIAVHMRPMVAGRGAASADVRARRGVRRAPASQRRHRRREVGQQHDAGQRLAHAPRHLAAGPQRDRRRQVPAQRSPGLRSPGAAETPPRTTARRCRPACAMRGAPDVVERRLRAERNALRAFGHQQRLDHQQAERRAARSGSVVSSTRGLPDLPRKRVDRRAQRRLQTCSVYRCSSNTMQFAAHPRIADERD